MLRSLLFILFQSFFKCSLIIFILRIRNIDLNWKLFALYFWLLSNVWRLIHSQLHWFGVTLKHLWKHLFLYFMFCYCRLVCLLDFLIIVSADILFLYHWKLSLSFIKSRLSTFILYDLFNSLFDFFFFDILNVPFKPSLIVFLELFFFLFLEKVISFVFRKCNTKWW